MTKDHKKLLIESICGVVFVSASLLILLLTGLWHYLNDTTHYVFYILAGASLIILIWVIVLLFIIKNDKLFNITNKVMEYFIILPTGLLLAGLINLTVGYISKVNGKSMEPTLYHNDSVLVRYHAKYNVNDLVVIEVNEKDYLVEDELIIKRVIGKAGDDVMFVYNSSKSFSNNEYSAYAYDVYNNGEVIETIYTYDLYELNENKEKTLNYFYYENNEQVIVEEIPDGFIFVIGDNSINSLDSRYIGLIRTSDVVGKAT